MKGSHVREIATSISKKQEEIFNGQTIDSTEQIGILINVGSHRLLLISFVKFFLIC